MGLPLVAALLTYAPVASAYHQGDERLIDETAHTLRAGELRLGLWKLELGPTSFVTLGTDGAPWIASFFVHSVVANGHAKVRVLHTRPLTVGLEGAVYHASVDGGSIVTGRGSLLLFPISLFASSDLSRRVSVHLGVVYSHLAVDGDIGLDLEASAARASIAATAVQLHAMTEVRVSRLVALTFQVHGQPYASPAAVRLTTNDASGNRVDFVGTVTPTSRAAVAAVAGVALSGRNVNVRIGAGYGAIFLPSMGIMIPIATPLPQVDAYVRF